MYKNRLREIMTDRNITQNGLSEKIGISRQTIVKILGNPFHDMSTNILTALLIGLDTNFYELGKVYSTDQYLEEQLTIKGFTNNNLEKLTELMEERSRFKLRYSPYCMLRCLNFYADKRSKRDFSGNIRININLDGLFFEVVDFDYFNPFSTIPVLEFIYEFKQLIEIFEAYAQKLSFDFIIFHVDFRFNKRLKTNDFLSFSSYHDLAKHAGTVTNKSKMTELVKLNILLQSGYTLQNEGTSRHTQLYGKRINNSILPPKQIESSFANLGRYQK